MMTTFDPLDSFQMMVIGLVRFTICVLEALFGVIFTVLRLAWEYKAAILYGLLCIVGTFSFFSIVLLLPWLLV